MTPSQRQLVPLLKEAVALPPATPQATWQSQVSVMGTLFFPSSRSCWKMVLYGPAVDTLGCYRPVPCYSSGKLLHSFSSSVSSRWLTLRKSTAVPSVRTCRSLPLELHVYFQLWQIFRWRNTERKTKHQTFWKLTVLLNTWCCVDHGETATQADQNI